MLVDKTDSGAAAESTGQFDFQMDLLRALEMSRLQYVRDAQNLMPADQ